MYHFFKITHINDAILYLSFSVLATLLTLILRTQKFFRFLSLHLSLSCCITWDCRVGHRSVTEQQCQQWHSKPALALGDPRTELRFSESEFLEENDSEICILRSSPGYFNMGGDPHWETKPLPSLSSSSSAPAPSMITSL